MGLKKLFKKTRKALGIPALTLGNAAKLGAAVATGGVGAGALALGTGVLKSKLKSAAIGGIKQVVRSKASKILKKRTESLTPPVAMVNKPALVDIRATTMPGGAPLPKAAVRLKGVKAPKRKKAASSAKKPAAAKKKGSGKGRVAPSGGKDFKALSASWKKAGKPGTWLDWVKSH